MADEQYTPPPGTPGLGDQISTTDQPVPGTPPVRDDSSVYDSQADHLAYKKPPGEFENPTNQVIPPSGQYQAAKYEPLKPSEFTPTTDNPALAYHASTGAANVDPQSSFIPDIVNFLVGPDMGVMGMKWDREGFSWDLESAKDYWHEHPLMTGMTVATDLAMAIPGVAAAMKIGRWGVAAGKFKYFDQLAAKKATSVLAAAKEAPTGEVTSTVKNLLENNMPYMDAIRNMAQDGYERTAEVKMLQDFGYMDPISSLLKTYSKDPKILDAVEKHGENVTAKLSPQLLEEGLSNVPESVMEKARIHAHQYQSTTRLAAKQMLSQDPSLNIQMSPIDNLAVKFNNGFKNAFWDETNRLTPSDAIGNPNFKNVERLIDPTLWSRMTTNLPTPEEAKGAAHYLLRQLAVETGQADAVPEFTGRLSPLAQQFVDNYQAASRPMQEIAHGMGLLSDEEKVQNPFHITLAERNPAAHLDQISQIMNSVSAIRLTRGGEEGERLMVGTALRPRLDNYALIPRKDTLTRAYNALQAGKMYESPQELVMFGLMNDRNLIESYKTVSDVISDTRYLASHDAMLAKYGDTIRDPSVIEHGGYINLDRALSDNAKSRLVRIINKKEGVVASDILGPNGDTLPWVRREIYNGLFEPHGYMDQSKNAAGWMEMLTTFFKTKSTVLNPATQMQNFLNNIAFSYQAGINPLRPSYINTAHSIIKPLNEYSKALQETADLTRLGKLQSSEISPAQQWLQANKDLNITYKHPDGMEYQIPFSQLIGETGTPDQQALMKELTFRNAFQYTDGWQHMQSIYGRMKDAGDPVSNLITGKTVAKWILDAHSPPSIASRADEELNAIQKFYKNKIAGSFDGLNNLYMQTDMIPKMVAFLHNKAEGLSDMGAALEVSRRFPMYKNVGNMVKLARRSPLPWITFTSEAARITKNNLMDHPLRVIPWMMAPQIMQATAYSLGFTPPGENYSTLEAAKYNAPEYMKQEAGFPGMVVYGGPRGNMAAGVASGAVTGGVLGSYLGGAPGGAIGALAGGAGGAGLSWLFDDSYKDELRAMAMRWLPHSSFMMQGLRRPDLDFSPRKGEAIFSAVMQDPFNIMRPFMNLLTGRDENGNEIKDDGTPIGKMHKMAALFMSTIAPPLMQKYGTSISSPDIAAYANEWTDGLIGSALGGLLATGIKAGPAGILGAAALGGVAGLGANIKQLYVDNGQMKDADGETGSTGQDFIFNNMGVVRNKPLRPETALREAIFSKQGFEDARGVLFKNWLAGVQNTAQPGDRFDLLAGEAMKKIQMSFQNEFKDPVKAQRAFTKFLNERKNVLNQVPALRGYNQQDLTDMLNASGDVSEEYRGTQWRVMREMLMRGREATILSRYNQEHQQRIQMYPGIAPRPMTRPGLR